MSIDPNDETPCPDDEVRKKYPEVATTPEWREKMVVARKARKNDRGKPTTQEELGRLVGTSQNMISLMEKGLADGGIDSSQFVLPVCHVLGIGPPVHFGSDAFKAWVEIGYLMEMSDVRQLEAMLRMITLALGKGDKQHDG